MEFTPISATEIDRRPRKNGGGSTRYNALAKAVGRLEIGQAIPVTPEALGVDKDMSDLKQAESFRSNVSAAVLRLVSKKLNRRHRTIIDAHGVVMVERVELIEKDEAPADDTPQEAEAEAEEAEEEEDFDEV